MTSETPETYETYETPETPETSETSETKSSSLDNTHRNVMRRAINSEILKKHRKPQK